MNLLLKWKNWPIARIVFLFAGALTFGGVVLGLCVNHWFLLLPLVVGAMQIIFTLTGFCPLVIILRKSGQKCLLENN